MFLTDRDGKWFMDKHKSKISPMERPRLSKEEKKKEKNNKQNIKKDHQHWNDWNFQIHWNNLEWVVSKGCNAKKKISVNIPTSLI